MVEAAYVKLKDHLRYLTERLVLMTFFSARVTDRDKKEMVSAVPKLHNQTSPHCQQMPETENFGAKRLKHFVGPDSWTQWCRNSGGEGDIFPNNLTASPPII